jgi:hypothetical protein
MFSGVGVRKPEYPRDFETLYGRTEDHLFAMYEAIKTRKMASAKEKAGDVIVCVSEIAEHAEREEERIQLKTVQP